MAGLFSKILGQFIDVIEWRDDSSNIVVYKFPDNDCEIKMGAQLIVRESQVAIFLSEGKLADVYTPGRYELTTQNMPILTTLRSWKYGFNSPFKCDVFFVNTKQFTAQKWGTPNPVMMRDSVFGVIRLRAFGVFSFRVIDAPTFLREISGTNSQYDAERISDQLRRLVVSAFTDMIAESKIPAIDLAQNYDELGDQATLKLAARFSPYGLAATGLTIENISLPEEVEKALDKRTTMGVLGDMGEYARYQTAEAIRDAAQNPGGVAGLGTGLGVGAGIGQAVGQAMNGLFQQPAKPAEPAQQAAQPANPAQAVCVGCGAQLPPGAKFCGECGAAQQRLCAGCGAKLPPGAKFCSECGAKA